MNPLLLLLLLTIVGVSESVLIKDIPGVTYLTRDHPAFKGSVVPPLQNPFQTESDLNEPSTHGRSILASFEQYFGGHRFEYNFRRLVGTAYVNAPW